MEGGVNTTAVFTAIADFRSLNNSIDASMVKLSAMQKLVKSASVTSAESSAASSAALSGAQVPTAGITRSLGKDIPAAASATEVAAGSAAAAVSSVGSGGDTATNLNSVATGLNAVSSESSGAADDINTVTEAADTAPAALAKFKKSTTDAGSGLKLLSGDAKMTKGDLADLASYVGGYSTQLAKLKPAVEKDIPAPVLKPVQDPLTDIPSITRDSTPAVDALGASFSRLPPTLVRVKTGVADVGDESVTVGGKVRSLTQEVEGLDHNGEALWKNMAYGRLAAGGLAVAFATLGFAVGKMSIDYNKMVQTQTVAFAAQLKSQSQAEQLTKDTQALASNSPFTFQEVAAPVQKLLGSGFSQQQILQGQGTAAKGIIVDIGNAAAATGPKAAASLNSITDALSRMQATGKVSQRIITELASAGINVKAALQNAFDLNDAQIDNITKTGLSAQQVTKAVLDYFNSNFAGSLQKSADTFSGFTKNIKEELSIGVGNAAHGLFTGIEKDLSGVEGHLSSFLGQMNKVGFMNALTQDAPVLASAVSGVEKAFVNVRAVVTDLEPEAKAFVTTLGGAAFAGVVTVVGAIGTGLHYVDDILKEIPGPAKEAVGAFAALYVVIKALEDSKKLYSLYETVTKLAGAGKAAAGSLQTTKLLPGGANRAQVAVQQAQQQAASQLVGANRALIASEVELEAATDKANASQAALVKSMATSTGATEAQSKAANDDAIAQQLAANKRTAAAKTVQEAEASLTGTVNAQTPALAKRAAAGDADAIAQTAMGDTAEAAAPKVATLGAAIDAVGGPLTLITVGIAAAVAALILFNKELNKNTAGVFDADASATALAKSMGQVETSTPAATSAVVKHTQAVDTFTEKNAALLTQLKGLNAEQQTNALHLVSYQLVSAGVSPADVQKDVTALEAALGSAFKAKPFNVSANVHVNWLVDPGVAEGLAATLKETLNKEGATKTPWWKSALDTVGSAALGPVADFFIQKHNNGPGGLIPTIPVAPASQAAIKATADTIQKQQQQGQEAQSTADILKSVQAVNSSNQSPAQKSKELSLMYTEIIKKQQGYAQSGVNANNVTDKAISLFKLLASSMSLGGDSQKKYEATLVEVYEKTKNWKTAEDAANKTLTDGAAATDVATGALQKYAAAWDQIDKTVNPALVTAFDNVVDGINKGFSSLGDAATGYADQLKLIEQLQQDQLTAQQQVVESTISGERLRESAQYDALQASGKASAASLSAMTSSQEATEKATDAQLAGIVGAQNYAAAQREMGNEAKTAADQISLSVQQETNELQIQNQNLAAFQTNIQKLTAYYTSMYGAAMGTQMAQDVESIDPTGAFAAKAAAAIGTSQGAANAAALNQNVALQNDNGVPGSKGSQLGTLNPAELNPTAATYAQSGAGSAALQATVVSALQQNPTATPAQIQAQLDAYGFQVTPDQIVAAAKGAIHNTAAQLWAAQQAAIEKAGTDKRLTGLPDAIAKSFETGTGPLFTAVTNYLKTGITGPIDALLKQYGLEATPTGIKKIPKAPSGKEPSWAAPVPASARKPSQPSWEPKFPGQGKPQPHQWGEDPDPQRGSTFASGGMLISNSARGGGRINGGIGGRKIKGAAVFAGGGFNRRPILTNALGIAAPRQGDHPGFNHPAPGFRTHDIDAGHASGFSMKPPEPHYSPASKKAEGGFQLPFGQLPEDAVVQPSQGTQGLVQWAESAAGPWEAFIPGAPSKRANSLKIWKQVGDMLGGLSGNMLSKAAMASGASVASSVNAAPQHRAESRADGGVRRRMPTPAPYSDGGFLEGAFAEGGVVGNSYEKHTHYHVDKPTIVASDMNGMKTSLQRANRKRSLVR